MPNSLQTLSLEQQLAERLRQALQSKNAKESDGKSEYRKLVDDLLNASQTEVVLACPEYDVHLQIATQVIALLRAFFAEREKQKTRRSSSEKKPLLNAIYFVGKRILIFTRKNLDNISSSDIVGQNNPTSALKRGAFLVAETCKLDSKPVIIWQKATRGYFVEPSMELLKVTDESIDQKQDDSDCDLKWSLIDNGDRWSAVRSVRRNSDSKGEAIVNERRDQVPPPEKIIQAVNSVQETGWKVNQAILDLLLKIPKEERHRHLGKKFPEPGAPNSDLENKRFESIIDFGKSMLEKGSFHIAHYLDFRGRVYAKVSWTQISPQGRDWEKALLRFSEKASLGEHGWKWFCNHLYSLSQEPARGIKFDARQKWVEDKRDEIEAFVNDPLGNGFGFWEKTSKKKKRWQFLAACQEACEAWRHFEQHHTFESFESDLPVNVDGVCNGYQHMSALIRDTVTAKLTNVLSTENEPQDYYDDIASKINLGDKSAVTNENVSDVYEQAIKAIQDPLKAFRKNLLDLAKSVSALKSVIYWQSQDGWLIRSYGEKRVKKSTNFSEFEGIDVKLFNPPKIRDETIVESKGNDCNIVAEVDLRNFVKDIMVPYGYGAGKNKFIKSLENPNITQKYRHHESGDEKLGKKKISNRLRLIVWEDSPLREQIDKRRIANSLLASYIHSLDATLLHRVVNAARSSGLMSIQVVHDSFGTQAGRMEELHQILLDEFTKLYGKSPLRDLIAFYLNRIEWLRSWHYSRKHDLRSTEKRLEKLLSVLDKLEDCIDSDFKLDQAEGYQSSPYLFS